MCKEEFASFYAPRQHKSKMHGFNLKKADSSPLVNNIDDDSLKEELRACEHFLVESEFERVRHKVFNYAVETLNTEIVNDKLDKFFNNLKCAAKVNLAFGFILKNLEDGRYRYFYAHENKTSDNVLQNPPRSNVRICIFVAHIQSSKRPRLYL